ncbi:hypothetical protein FDG2_3892 [Candidatus Protofrankia californiensis]|uniref:Luciferase-like domain-containing protein n=1 Tax=Candidatus Protofrankia californiensis TaxID=1839754 RepID=A0A1C3P1R3_9ACTN|nr:hypothetical protein FDG2_3892 [Candidatus Protofrankia californiensis]
MSEPFQAQPPGLVSGQLSPGGRRRGRPCRPDNVTHDGETLTAVGAVNAPGTQLSPILVAALGPVMLWVAGELADGTIMFVDRGLTIG